MNTWQPLTPDVVAAIGDYLEARSLRHVRRDLRQMERRIMAKQAELTAQVNLTAEKIGKIATETRSLLTKIDELAAAVENQDNVSAELQAAVDNMSAQAAIVDDLVPDSQATPPQAVPQPA